MTFILEVICPVRVIWRNRENAEEAERYVYWLGGVITGHAIASGQSLGKGIDVYCLRDYVRDMCEVKEYDYLSTSVIDMLEKLKNGGNAFLNSDTCSLN